MFKNFKIDNARRVEFEDKFIQIPKSKWAYLRNNIDTFHSTGGEGTPSEPIPIVNVSSYNKTVCGKNLFDISTLTNKFDVDTQITDNDIIITATSLGTFRRVRSTNFILPAGTYYLRRYFEIISGTDVREAGLAILYDVSTGNVIRQNNGSFTLLNATEVHLGLYLNTSSALVDLLSVRFYNIQIERSSSYTVWQKYNGKTYPYRLEDINGVLHEGGDLPDGTADSFDGKELVSNIGKLVIDESTVITKHNDMSTQPLLARFAYSDSSVAYGSGVINLTDTYCRATHLKGVGWGVSNTAGIDYEYCWLNPASEPVLQFQILKSRFSDYANLTNAERIAEFKTLINGCVVEYKLATPETYQIKQYGETYGGVVWEYNEKPIQVEDSVCNVFSDKNVKMNFKAVSY